MDILDAALGKSSTTSPDGGFRNVESSGLESPSGELLGIVSEAASYFQSGFAGGRKMSILPEIQQVRIRAKLHPRNDAFTFLALPIQLLEPSSGIAFGEIFGGELSGARAVPHVTQHHDTISE
jgi:hypothetical protein